MTRRLPMFAIAAIAASIVLGGCSGHSAVLPNRSLPSVTSGTTVIFHGSINGSGPQLFAHVRRPAAWRRPLTISPTSYTVTTNVYQGDASPTKLTKTITITCPCSSPVNASVSVSGVTIADNLWALMSFTANLSDGTNFAAGEEAGFFNVTSSPTTVTLTDKTTRGLQIGIAGLERGMFGTSNLNDPTWFTILLTNVGATGVPFNPATGTFTPDEVNTNLSDLAHIYDAYLNITDTSAPGSIAIVPAWSNPQTLDKAVNLQATSLLLGTAFGSTGGGPSGIGCTLSAFVPNNTTSTTPIVVPSFVFSNVFPQATSMTTIASPCPDHVMVGHTNDPLNGTIVTSFFDVWLDIDIASGKTNSVTLVDKAANKNITTDVPAVGAYGQSFWETNYPYFLAKQQPNFINNPDSQTFFLSNANSSLLHIPITFTGVFPNNVITGNLWNPWNISPTDMEVIFGASFYQAARTDVFNPSMFFADSGQDYGENNWVRSGTITSETQGSAGYVFTTSGSGIGVLTTHTPWIFAGYQKEVISGGGYPFNSPGAVITIKATDTSNVVHQNSGVVGTFGSAEVDMDSVENPTQMKSVEMDLPTSSLNFTIINAKDSGVGP